MYQISLGQTSPSIEEGIVAEWLKKVGESVQAGDCLVRIESSEAVFEVQTSVAGTLLKVLASPGKAIRSSDVLCYVGDQNEDIPEKPTTGSKQNPKTLLAPEPEQASTKVPRPETSGNVIPVLMPQAGQSMEEGTMLSWKVAEGDVIELGQVIFEIETDKATMEVEAVDAGRVARIVAREGDIVEVKIPVAYLAENDAEVDAYLAAIGTSTGQTSTRTTGSAVSNQTQSHIQKTAVKVEGGRIKASPAAKKLATQRGVDLASVSEGSGPGGRILSTDVALAQAVPVTSQGSTGLSKMRRAIAKNLLYSKQNIPHFYAKVTVDAQTLFETYQKTKAEFKCTINDFVTAACAKAVREFEPFRSQYQDDNIKVLPDVNIGIAVGTDDGLSVPVVLKADTRSLQDLAARSRQVIESARNGKHEGVGQGVFTITNLGMFGVENFQAIINPPESAILAVSALREGVIVLDGDIKPTRLMSLTVSVDHRVIDGVVAAQFLARVKELLEAPEQLVS